MIIVGYDNKNTFCVICPILLQFARYCSIVQTLSRGRFQWERLGTAFHAVILTVGTAFPGTQ